MSWFSEIHIVIPEFSTSKCSEILHMSLTVTPQGIRMEATFSHWKTPNVILRFENVHSLSLGIAGGIIELGELLVSELDQDILVYDNLKRLTWRCDKIEFVGLSQVD